MRAAMGVFMLNWETRPVLMTGVAAFDSGILGLVLQGQGDAAVLYAVTGGQGGVQSYFLTDLGQRFDLLAQEFTTASIPIATDGMTLLNYGGDVYLSVGQTLGGGLLVLPAGADGPSGEISALPALALPGGRISELETVSIYTFSATSEGIWRVGQGTPEQVAAAEDGAPGPMAGVMLGGTPHLVVTRPVPALVETYRVTPDGGLILVDQTGAPYGLGIGAASAIRTVVVNGVPYAIVAGAGSDSLTVLRLSPDGQMSVVDHVLDTRETRFGGVTALEVITHNGQAYVVAGGADDGLSVFTLLPGGTLVHRTTLASTVAAPLNNITDIALWAVSGGIDVYAVGQTGSGITHLHLDAPPAGASRIGGGGADVLNGTGNADHIVGHGGNDTLRGFGRTDVLLDGAGRDTLSGGQGGDVFVLALDGDLDTITDFEPAIDLLDFSGWTGLYDPAQLTIISTATGAQVIFENEVLVLLRANGTSLTRAEVEGAIRLDVSRPPLAVSSTPLPDPPPLPPLPPDPPVPIVGTNGPDSVEGTGAADLLSGLPGADTLMGYGGDDRLFGGAGSDMLYGALGQDVLRGDMGDDSLYAGQGNDFVDGGAGSDTAFLWLGNDVYIAGPSSDGVGDTAYGEGGNDQLFGGDGADVLWGGSGRDTLWGNAGNDQLTGGTEADTLGGNAGNDTLRGEAGDDSLMGGVGFDLIFGGAGQDRVRGGLGRDVIYLEAGDDQYFGDLQGGFLGADRVYGGPGRDTLLFLAGDDVGLGGTGDDSLRGGDGRDLLFGEEGADLMAGEVGDDTLFGGNGHDRLWGGAGRDSLSGDAGNDMLEGRDGNDRLAGGDGHDTLRGGVGDDVIFAGYGRDTLFGGAGRDTLHGRQGDDTLYGGAGADVFILRPGDGSDLIMDFELGVDRLQFAGDPQAAGSVTTRLTAQGIMVVYTEGEVLLEGLYDGNSSLLF